MIWRASPLELRRIAEFDLRPRLLAVTGVAQVTALGGELPEFQVRVRPANLLRYGLSLAQVAQAAEEAHAPVGAGYLPDVSGRELPLRPDTRVRRVDDIASTVVGEWNGAPVTLAQVALGEVRDISWREKLGYRVEVALGKERLVGCVNPRSM